MSTKQYAVFYYKFQTRTAKVQDGKSHPLNIFFN